MLKYHVAVCDDEKSDLDGIVQSVQQYDVQGYGIAFRYLVKPLDKSLLTAAMDAVVQELNSKHFTVEYEGATLSLETSDIYYLESHGHKVSIHCKFQDLTLRMTIPEALEQLPKRCFASPHKSYLVNFGTSTLGDRDQTLPGAAEAHPLPAKREQPGAIVRGHRHHPCGKPHGF